MEDASLFLIFNTSFNVRPMNQMKNTQMEKREKWHKE